MIISFLIKDLSKKALGIQGVAVQASFFLHKGNTNQNGVQIDLILDRNDGMIHLFEIKFSQNKFILQKNTVNNYKKKEICL